MSAYVQFVAMLQDKNGIISFAKIAGAFDDGSEHRLHIGRGGGDHVEDVGAAGLVSQRLFEIVRLGLHFFEQLHVLDRDHSLIGEDFQEINHLTVERAGFAPSDANRADRNAITQHRHHHYAAPTDCSCELLDVLWDVGGGLNVSSGYDLSCSRHSGVDTVRHKWIRQEAPLSMSSRFSFLRCLPPNERRHRRLA